MTMKIPVMWVCVAMLLLAACDDTKPTTPLSAPQFGQLQIPDPSGSNNWTSFTTNAPPPEVLPTRGRGVRLYFRAPVGSTFTVTLRELDGTMTALTENQGTPAAPAAGYFQIIDVNVASSPNYDILVVNRSLRTDQTDSAPMIVPLRQRKVFTVTVMVSGSGHVTSNPGGIQCGTAPSGTPLTQCTYVFGPGTVSLAAQSNDSTTTRFLGWTGNCPAGVQTCNLTLDGMAAMSATATFVPRGSPLTASTCPTAAPVPGLRWIDVPDCATGNIAAHPGISHPAMCDSGGYFCCEPGPEGSNAPRCGGSRKIESPPDCMRNAPRGLLRQPGGCYEVDAPL
jgi:hypothetical protein